MHYGYRHDFLTSYINTGRAKKSSVVEKEQIDFIFPILDTINTAVQPYLTTEITFKVTKKDKLKAFSLMLKDLTKLYKRFSSKSISSDQLNAKSKIKEQIDAIYYYKDCIERNIL
jgi:hypothetical protein